MSPAPFKSPTGAVPVPPCRGMGSPAAGSRPLSAAGRGPKTPEAGVTREASRPASGKQPVPVAGVQPAAGTGASRARKARLTGLALLAARMPENGGSNSLDYHLRQMLRDDFTGRLLWQHNSDSRRAHRGFPDWVIAGPGGVLWRELKREGKHPTEEQDAWLCMLTDAGEDADVWRPSDLYSGRIARELAAVAGLIRAVTR